MNINELKVVLDENNIKPEFCFVGIPCPILYEGYCINFEDGKWAVYFQERGRKRPIRYFQDESSACELFLEWLLSDSHSRIGSPSSTPPPQ